MKFHLSFLILASFAVSNACAPAGETAAQREAAIQADQEALTQLGQDYEAVFNAQDAAGVAATYADDAVRSMPNAAPTTGNDAIQASLQATFDQFEGQITLSRDEVQVAGDWAFSAGTAAVTLTPKEGGEAIELRSSYISILRRQTDGSWKIARSVVSSNDPLQGDAEERQ